MKKIKKGFTLVELLVVIAILAILATVSTITYFVFINSAKQSADEQAVTQMNTALEAQKVLDAPENVEEAKDALEAAGFNVSDYVPLDKDNIFYYDEAEIKVLIYDQAEGKVVFPADLASKYSNISSDNKPGSWYLLNEQTYEWVNVDTAVELQDKLRTADETQIIKLENDITLPLEKIGEDYYFVTNAKTGNARIDLNGHTMNFSVTANVGGYQYFTAISSYNIYLTNGTILANSQDSSQNPAIIVSDNTTLTLNNINYISENSSFRNNSITVNDYSNLIVENSTIDNKNEDGTGVLLYGSQSKANIFNSTINATTYGISTNAQGDLSWEINLSVQNSNITSSNGPAVLLNVPGISSFTNSNLIGDGQGVIIRGGNSSFNNCLIKCEGDASSLVSSGGNWEMSKWDSSPFINGIWSSGNMVQLGGLIVGDWSSNAYNYDATVTLIESSVYMNDAYKDLPIVYLSQDGENTTTFKYDKYSKYYKTDEEFSVNNAVLVNSAETIDKGEIIKESI